MRVSMLSRGAVESFVRAIARELAPKRINFVSPGVIDTPISPLKGEERAAFYAKTIAGNIIPRAGTADEVTHTGKDITTFVRMLLVTGVPYVLGLVGLWFLGGALASRLRDGQKGSHSRS